MIKIFTEYQSKKETIPYSASTICFYVTDYAKKYIKENRSAIKNVSQDVRDAVLVDAINYLGSVGGSFFGLITKDLYDNKEKPTEEVDSISLITVLKNHYAMYIFGYGIVDSVLRNKHIQERFDANDGAKVLVDFINYIIEENGYERKFTINELYDKYKNLEYKIEMERLKKFLEKSSEYSEKLVYGIDIENIYIFTLGKYYLEEITKDGKCYCLDQTEETRTWVKKEIEESLYAMAYAYAKMFNETQPTKIEILDDKILEMRNSK